jgi:hypothetical protein
MKNVKQTKIRKLKQLKRKTRNMELDWYRSIKEKSKMQIVLGERKSGRTSIRRKKKEDKKMWQQKKYLNI